MPNALKKPDISIRRAAPPQDGYTVASRPKRSEKCRPRDLRVLQFVYPEEIPWRPTTRADCATVPRPCPYVGCRYNMFLDVGTSSSRGEGTSSRSIFYTRPDVEPWDVPPGESCALDMADQGDMILEDIGEILGVTRERVRQIETAALEKLAEADPPEE